MLRRGPCGLGDPGRLRGARDSEAEGGAAAAGGGHAAERMGRPGRRCLGVPSHPPPPPRSRASRPRGWGGGGWKRTVAASSARGEGGMGLRRPRPLRSGNGHVGDALRPTGDPALSRHARAHQTSPPPPPKSCRQGGSKRGPALRLHTLPLRRMCKRMGGWRGVGAGGGQEKPARPGLLRG